MNAMQTEQNTLTVVYQLEEGISSQQARELINSNTPQGFQVRNIQAGSSSSSSSGSPSQSGS
jgi:hypothetical protein